MSSSAVLSNIWAALLEKVAKPGKSSICVGKQSPPSVAGFASFMEFPRELRSCALIHAELFRHSRGRLCHTVLLHPSIMEFVAQLNGVLARFLKVRPTEG